MNFAAEQIDMWPRRGAPAPVDDRPTFCEWRERVDPGRQPSYPARASVGRYLAEGLRRLLAAAPARVQIDHRRSRIESISRDDGKWVADSGRFDEVLLALGHAKRSQAGLDRGSAGRGVRFVPAVFPVGELLSETTVPPRSRVAIRGFALTMIDAALALTEGRGGRFRARAPVGLDCVTEAARSSPAVILPFSRSGRPMLAKTDPDWSRERGLDRLLEPALDRVASLPSPIDVHGDLLPALHAVAAEALARLGSDGGERSALGGWLEAATGIEPPRPELSPSAELARSIAIAAGTEAPDHQWALGHAWRATYPAIVARFGGRRPRARAVARVPAPRDPNGADRLRTAADQRREARRADRRRRRRPRSQSRAARAAVGVDVADAGRREHRVDVVIDAVLPGPGAVGLASRQSPGLLADGLVRIAAGRRGLELTPRFSASAPAAVRRQGWRRSVDRPRTR